MYYAHSGLYELNIPAQTYQEHIGNVYNKVKSCSIISDFFKKVCCIAGLMHDLGKLHPDNQVILSGTSTESKLPYNHVDAGVAWCLNEYRKSKDLSYLYAAFFIKCHHSGLCNRQDLFLEKSDLFTFERKIIFSGGFRDQSESELGIVSDITDKFLNHFMSIHMSIMHIEMIDTLRMSYDSNKFTANDLRIAFSVLVDADHSDTARHYGCPFIRPPMLNASTRIKLLEEYVNDLQMKSVVLINQKVVNSRSRLYNDCKNADLNYNFYNCSARTGHGKTLSSMLLALRIAEKYSCNKIHVIIPFTNIINQSVEVYRKCLVEPTEHRQSVVNEIHSKVEYSSYLLRKYSQQWNSPINVSTSVQFFNSLFSSNTSSIRKICHYANSVVVLDEYHISMPNELWKVTLEVMKELTEKYNVKFIFCSGSEVKYWDSFQIDIEIQNVLSDRTEAMSVGYENQRFQVKDLGIVDNDDKLLQIIKTKAFSKEKLKHNTLIVCNTVINAISMYLKLKTKLDVKVFHLSSWIMPVDRDKILNDINQLLETDQKIILVATSIIECGIDFSFGMGFREKSSIQSTLQFAGRINRNREGRQRKVYEWSFSSEWLRESNFTYNPRMIREVRVREDLEVNVENCTLTTTDLINYDRAERMSNNELLFRFETQSDFYRVIEDRTVSVLIDKQIAKQVEQNKFVPPYIINKNSVNVYRHKIQGDNEPGPWFNFVKNIASDNEEPFYIWDSEYSVELGIYEAIIASGSMVINT